MIVTALIIPRFDSVIGIITTNIWIWLRSLDERLISWPGLGAIVIADVQRHDVPEEPLAPGASRSNALRGRRRSDGTR